MRHRSRRLLLPIGVLLAGSALAVAGAPPDARQQAAFERALGRLEAGQTAAARRALEPLARQGVDEAAFVLGLMLADQGREPAAARRWLEQAAVADHAGAQLALAQRLDAGRLGPRDPAAALPWFERAAAAGSVDAQIAAGTAYYLGRGAPRSMVQAARWYLEAARAGDVGAMYLVAAIHAAGDGVERDLRLARYWYEAAARAGDPAAPGKLRELDQLEGPRPATAPP